MVCCSLNPKITILQEGVSLWVSFWQRYHVGQVHWKISSVISVVIRKEPRQHLLDALQMQGPVSFPGCSQEIHQHLHHLQVAVPKHFKRTIVVFAVFLLKIEYYLEFQHRYKPVEFPWAKLFSDIL